jgi:hypothetical protein
MTFMHDVRSFTFPSLHVHAQVSFFVSASPADDGVLSYTSQGSSCHLTQFIFHELFDRIAALLLLLAYASSTRGETPFTQSAKFERARVVDPAHGLGDAPTAMYQLPIARKLRGAVRDAVHSTLCIAVNCEDYPFGCHPYTGRSQGLSDYVLACANTVPMHVLCQSTRRPVQTLR